ncbi:L,D-transpeptidase [Fictibacillus nanhaiensis]|uniref:L,D-transpeptidase n=1 Tax=Fictibacillus nanhaiensis TaxID=742169 RepID=UPI003AF32651
MMPYEIYISTTRKRLALVKDGKVIKRYPIGVGKMLTPTPTGTYTIINKAPNPGGPFGVMWMGLSRPHYGIHGTDTPSSIGKNVSKGCVRMHNNHVLELSQLVPIGTKVVIRA